jgi:hypothetical protein
LEKSKLEWAIGLCFVGVRERDCTAMHVGAYNCDPESILSESKRRPMVIMCLVDGSIHALDAESGRLKWSMSSGSSVVSAFTRDERGDKRSVSGAVEGGSTPSERLEAGKAGGDDAGQEEARIIDVEWDGRDEVVGRDKEPGSNLPARRPEHDSAVAEVKDGKRGAGRGGAADEVETPEIIPSYEKGGGLWLYVDGRLKRVEMSASQIVEASPFIGQVCNFGPSSSALSPAIPVIHHLTRF